MAMRPASVLMLAMLLPACGDPDVTTPDGAVAGDATGPGTVTAPEPPASPQSVCPDGWREEAGACDPWPDAVGRIDCPEIDRAHLPGTPGCARIGTECAADGWPSDLPTDAPIVYVRRDAAAGGTGTQAAPLRDIVAGVAAASAGTVLALAIGSYDGIVDLPADVTLHGACTDLTLVGLATPSPSGMGRITARATGGAVRNLRVGGGRPGLWVVPGAALDVRDVVVDSTGIGGVIAQGDFSADGLHVFDTTPAADRTGGRALHAEGAAAVSVRRALFDGNREIGVIMRGSAVTLTMEDSAIVDTGARLADGTAGVGLAMTDGATGTARRVALEGSRAVGLDVRDAGGGLVTEHLVVRNTIGQEADGTGGTGVSVGGTATLEIRGALVERNAGTQVVSYLESSTLTVRDVVVRDTAARMDGLRSGVGVFANEGGHIDVERATISNTASFALGGIRSSLTVADVVVSGTTAHDGSGLAGAGVVVVDSSLSAARIAVSGGHYAGLNVEGADGVGDVSDLRIERVEGQPADGAFGHGLDATDGASITATRVVIDAARGVGAAAFDDGSELVIVDFVLRGTRVLACAETTCAGAGAGIGLVARDGTVDGRRFVIESSALAGVQIAGSGEIDLSDGEITGSPIGVNVQREGYDFDRVSADVTFRDLERNVDATVLPVPDAVDPRAFVGDP